MAEPSSLEHRSALCVDTDRSISVAAGSVRVLAGKESVDIGLLVKNARGPVCVPDYARPVPEGSGWQYSQALVGVLTQYKVRD